MTIAEAVIKVMRMDDRPLTPGEAWERILEEELYEFRTPKPVGVVQFTIRRHCEGVELAAARKEKFFKQESDGRYSPLPKISLPKDRKISDSSQATLEEEVRTVHKDYLELFKKRIITELKQLDPRTFEIFSKHLLQEACRFEDVEVTDRGSDGGIDGHGQVTYGVTKLKLHAAFQSKRWTRNNVGRPDIQKFRGAIQGQFEWGVFITTSSFTREAKEESRKPGAVLIELIDGVQIANLMIERKFGVQEESLSIYTLALDMGLYED